MWAMARGKGVIVCLLAVALGGCASALGVDGDYEVVSEFGDDGAAGAEGSSDGSHSDRGISGSSGGHDGSDALPSFVDSSGGPDNSNPDVDASDATVDSSGDPGIACGTAGNYCPLGTEVCCAGTTAASQACTAPSACASPLTPMACDDADDCPSGQICCGQLDPTGEIYVIVNCQSTCAEPFGHHFCDPAGNDCPSGYKCTASTLLPGHYACL
jgi:hypothetical protein